jgi:hypothetical protein
VRYDEWTDPGWVAENNYPHLTWVLGIMMRNPGGAVAQRVENVILDELVRRLTPLDMQVWFEMGAGGEPDASRGRVELI